MDFIVALTSSNDPEIIPYKLGFFRSLAFLALALKAIVPLFGALAWDGLNNGVFNSFIQQMELEEYKTIS